MSRQNLFDGDSYHALFASAAYKLLMSRKWVTLADVMADYMRLNSADDLPASVSKCDNYGELKKAFPAVCRTIMEKEGNDCIEQQGNNRCKQFRYIGENDAPLADMLNAKAINDLKKYWLFCQDSAGFFPASWLEYFFKDCQDLLDIKAKKRKGEQVLDSSQDRILKNLDLLPYLYESIKNNQVLLIDYKPLGKEKCNLRFHPHFLKEYNGRWFLFGHAEDKIPEYGYNLALDRIVEKPRELYDTSWIPAPPGFYSTFFTNIVGVSHRKEAIVETITIRARGHFFDMIKSKPIHHTQTVTIPYAEHDDGEYGDFSVNVELNNEFIGRILQMGPGLEIIAPKHIRDTFKARVKSMLELYEDEA